MGAFLLGTLAAALLETLAADSNCPRVLCPKKAPGLRCRAPRAPDAFLSSCCPPRFQSACGGTPLRGVAARPDCYPGKNVSDKRYST